VVRTRLGVTAVATGDSGMQTGYMSVGNTVGFELFDEFDVEEIAREAARRALLKLHARPAPSGTMPVVIKSGGGAVLFHEACGHGLEADAVAKQATVFAGRIGEQVASPLVTLVDTGTIAGQWGSAAIDDEGRPAQRNVLIENGILVDYMWDGLRARKEGRPSSGNGRRQSYQDLPMVRMTNTFLESGHDDPDEIIRSTEQGIYCAGLGGGSVNTATGDFVFGMTEATSSRTARSPIPSARATWWATAPRCSSTSMPWPMTSTGAGPACAGSRASRCRPVWASPPCGSPSSPSAAPHHEPHQGELSA